MRKDIKKYYPFEFLAPPFPKRWAKRWVIEHLFSPFPYLKE